MNHAFLSIYFTLFIHSIGFFPVHCHFIYTIQACVCVFSKRIRDKHTRINNKIIKMKKKQKKKTKNDWRIQAHTT